MRPGATSAGESGGPRSRRALLLGVACALPCLVVLWVHAAHYLPFIGDDAFISLRYASRLLEGEGLTWTDGERVEGYSNLLWVLLCAGLGFLGVDLIDATRVLGIGSASLALLAVMHACRPREAAGALASVGGMAGLALCGPVAVWSVGGLEQPLLACLLAWALVWSYPLLEPDPTPGRWWLPAVPLALACWTRPDAPLFTAAACLGILLARGARPSAVMDGVRLAAIPAVATLTQLGFRLLYYGDWLPNSAHAKVGITVENLTSGAVYLVGGYGSLVALAAPALVVGVLALRDPGAARRVRFLLAPLVVWSAYVAVIGGDIFPGWRHHVPVAVVLSLLLSEGLLSVARRGPAALAVAAAVLAGCLPALGWMQLRDAQNRRALAERWEWDGQVVGNLLRTAFADERPLLAADPAGCLPYFSGLPSLDLLGINDRYMATHRPPSFGRGYLGHELGDGKYVLDREPDLVVFCFPSGSDSPCFRSGLEMAGDSRFGEQYRLVAFEGRDPRPFRSLIWVRAEGGRIGIARAGGRVTVPGFLFSDYETSVARLDAQGRLGMVVGGSAPAALADLPLEPGRWRLTVECEGAPVTLEARSTVQRRTLARAAEELVFDLEEDAVDLEVSVPPGLEAHLRLAVFEKL